MTPGAATGLPGDVRVIGQIPVCWDPDRDTAVERAHEQFRWFAGGWAVNSDLPTTAGFAGATQFVRPEDVAESIPCGPDLDAIVEAVREYWEAGFTDIALVQIGDEWQDLFLKEAAGSLLEKLRARVAMKGSPCHAEKVCTTTRRRRTEGAGRQARMNHPSDPRRAPGPPLAYPSFAIRGMNHGARSLRSGCGHRRRRWRCGRLATQRICVTEAPRHVAARFTRSVNAGLITKLDGSQAAVERSSAGHRRPCARSPP